MVQVSSACGGHRHGSDRMERQRAGTATNGNEWRYAVTPYMWLTGLEGDVGVGRVSSSVDLSPSDILRNLKFGIMGAGEARKGSLRARARWDLCEARHWNGPRDSR
jgi:hypothetical protein